MTQKRPEAVHLGAYTWTELDEAFTAGVDTVILPLGATEQHGPHLPLATDTRLATAIAERVAHRLGDTLVAPAVSVGPSPAHANFPGTVSISAGTLEPLLREHVESFEAQGFERIVLLPGHGGWFPIIEAVSPALTRVSDADLVTVGDFRRYTDLLDRGLSEAGIDVDEPAPHAGASETAMLLAVAPESVREECPDGHTGDVSAAKLFSEGIETYAENGVLGDTRAATAEAGETILSVVADGYAESVRSAFAALSGDGS